MTFPYTKTLEILVDKKYSVGWSRWVHFNWKKKNSFTTWCIEKDKTLRTYNHVSFELKLEPSRENWDSLERSYVKKYSLDICLCSHSHHINLSRDWLFAFKNSRNMQRLAYGRITLKAERLSRKWTAGREAKLRRQL